MGSIFGSYNVAVSGMRVNQAGLAVTSHNISNINTIGYTRQTMVSEDSYTQQNIGSGTDLQEIKRICSQFLNRAYMQQNATLSYWETKSSYLHELEQAFNDFSEGSGTTGLQQTLEEFFNSWEELAKDPDNITCRQIVLEYGKVLVETVTLLDEQIQGMQEDICKNCVETVENINYIAERIASLNSKIIKIEVAGVEASDLRDERDALLFELSALTNISVSEKSNGSAEVIIGGVSLVSGSSTHKLAVQGDATEDNPLCVQWEELGLTANITDGKLKAFLEDSTIGEFPNITEENIPVSCSMDSVSAVNNIRQALNTLIVTIALKVNALHSSGAGLDGSTGIDFFIPIDEDGTLSINNLQVNPALEQLTNIAAKSSDGAGDNTIANQISNIKGENYFKFHSLTMNCENFYESLVSWLGITSNNAESFYSNQSILLEQITNQRQSLSSVSMDEEMSRMIVYQNAYSASARVLRTIDSLLEDLIRELG